LDERCFLRHDREPLGRAAIAEGNRTADPNPFAFRSGDLVPDSFADDLAFELGEGEQVSLPMLEVVLKDWVTETKETACSSKSSTSLAKSARDLVSRSTL
jgi:hypothetical protein